MHTRRLALRLAAVALLVGVTGCVRHLTADVTLPEGSFRSDASTVQMVSAFVGANVYIPSTVAIVGHRAHTLSVFNATEQPHGFAIAGLGIETTLPPKEETQVALPPLEGGQVYRIHCQLHAAHRGGTLVVLPGGDGP